MRLIGYIRVSTDQQAESGLGLEAQKNSIESYAKRAGHLVHQMFKEEGLSGSLSIEKRPIMLETIACLKKGDLLVVAKRDRLGRDPLVMAMIESAVTRKGARIISAAGEGTDGDDPSSILMRRMIDAFSEYERLIIKSRTKSALQAKKKRGERVGHIPYGYLLSEHSILLEQHPEEKKIVDLMKMLQKDGFSLRKIAYMLNERLLFNRNDAKWHHASVWRILKNSL